MNCKLILVLCLHITAVYTAPIKLQLLPLQYGMQSQNLFPLQHPFREALPNMQPYMYPQQPIVLLLPNIGPVAESDDRYSKLNEENSNNLKSSTGDIDENNDAVILDAEPNTTAYDLRKPAATMPDGARFSIGQIISYIPFLPIEINVPDTIGWIAGLFPSNWFGRPGQKPENIKRLSNRGPMPILVLPAPMIQ